MNGQVALYQENEATKPPGFTKVIAIPTGRDQPKMKMRVLAKLIFDSPDESGQAMWPFKNKMYTHEI